MIISMILGCLILFAGTGVFVEGWREPNLIALDRKTGSSRTGWKAGIRNHEQEPFETIGNAGATTTSRLLPPAICAFPI
jgi:hypothetical protein